jgi:hypothetical protein
MCLSRRKDVQICGLENMFTIINKIIFIGHHCCPISLTNADCKVPWQKISPDIFYSSTLFSSPVSDLIKSSFFRYFKPNQVSDVKK